MLTINNSKIIIIIVIFSLLLYSSINSLPNKPPLNTVWICSICIILFCLVFEYVYLDSIYQIESKYKDDLNNIHSDLVENKELEYYNNTSLRNNKLSNTLKKHKKQKYCKSSIINSNIIYDTNNGQLNNEYTNKNYEILEQSKKNKNTRNYKKNIDYLDHREKTERINDFILANNDNIKIEPKKETEYDKINKIKKIKNSYHLLEKKNK